MMHRPNYVLMICAVLVLALGGAGCDGGKSTAGDKAAASPNGRDDPGAVMAREFLFAMFAADEQALRQLIVPDDDAHVLWEGRGLPPEVRQLMQAQLNRLTFREAEPGEEVTLPDQKVMTIPSSPADPSTRVLIPLDDPTFEGLIVILRGHEGGWRVDAGPLIQARLAARELRRPGAPAG